MKIKDLTFQSEEDSKSVFHPDAIKDKPQDYVIMHVTPFIEGKGYRDDNPLMLLIHNPIIEKHKTTRIRKANLYKRINPNIRTEFNALTAASQFEFQTTCRKDFLRYGINWHPGKVKEAFMELLGNKFIKFDLPSEITQGSKETQPRLIYKSNKKINTALSTILGGELIKLKIRDDSMEKFLHTGLQPDFRQRYAFNWFDVFSRDY